MDWMEQRKAALKRDFESVTEKSWNHFYCPILHRDEDAELCRAHVINEAFREADRSWTVQRADVDNYYGSLFEADFVAMDKKDDPIVEEALVDKDVARQFRPKFVLDGDVKEHYIPSDVDSVPEGHTTFAFHLDDSIVPYTLKLAPEQVTQSLDGRWEVLVDKDIRLAALVSLLKCAHLTLFHLLGYRYALSSGGLHLGREILGRFYLKTRGLPREKAIEIAKFHFKPYASVVRPVISMSADFKGTLTDGYFYACGSGANPWGLGILIKFSGQTHMVIVPTLQDADSAVTFSNFLDSSFPRIEARTGRILPDRFELSTESHMMEWPETTFDPTE